MKFRKKPVVIEAIQWNGTNTVDLLKFDELDFEIDPPYEVLKINGLQTFKIKTLEGLMIVNMGDWIIKGIKGEFYPCKPDIFEATYEAVSES